MRQVSLKQGEASTGNNNRQPKHQRKQKANQTKAKLYK